MHFIHQRAERNVAIDSLVALIGAIAFLGLGGSI